MITSTHDGSCNCFFKTTVEMPPKRDKRKAGASGNGGSVGSTAASRRMTRHNASAGAGANNGASAPSKRVTTPKPEASSGRSTNNSRGKRRVVTSRASTPTVKRGKRVMTRGKKEKELNSFKDDNGEVYKIGGETERERERERECVCVCVNVCAGLQVTNQ